MQLGVYSLEKVLYQGEASSVNCNTKSGEITILNHHEALISILASGVLKIIDTHNQEYYIPVDSGFLEVNSRNETKILVQETAI
jgi:F0F1-type ATP synthase epsilon subunit